MISEFSHRLLCIHILGFLAVFLIFPPRVFCNVKSLGNIIKNVGQDVVFMWNTRNGISISSARWGVLSPDGSTIKPLLIYMSSSTGPLPGADLETIAVRYKERVSWVGNLSAGHAWFKLTNLTLQDTNQYATTILEQGESEISSPYSVHLTVSVHPKFLPSHPALKYQIIEGQDLNTNCTAIGPPTPNITWVNITDGNNDIKSQGLGSALLQIENIQRFHGGMFECQAKNNPNENATTTRTRVVVYFKPAIDESQSTSKSKSWNGNSISLKCFVSSGLPSPRITWYKPTNQSITSGVNIIPGGSEVTIPTTADQGDYGQYKCRAANFVGSDEYVINVIKLYPPGPAIIKITKLDASSLTLRWTKPDDDGGLVVTGYLLEVRSRPPLITVNTHAVITGLKANATYTVNLYSENAAGYGVGSSRVITTRKIGKPAVPEFLSAILETELSGSELSVALRWEEPNDNGGNITRYTIYVKEVARKTEWTKYDDVTYPWPNPLEFRITKDIVYGKTYMFMVTAWNKYGESVKDVRGAKTVNTTASKAFFINAIKTGQCEDGASSSPIVVGVVIAIFVISLGFNVLQYLYLRRRLQMSSQKGRQSQKRKMRESKKDATGDSYENDFESEEKTSSVPTISPARQPVQTAPEYESIPAATGGSYENDFELEDRAQSATTSSVRQFVMQTAAEYQSIPSPECDTKRDATGDSYENDFESEDKATSAPSNVSSQRKPVQTAPEYETIPQVLENVISNEAHSSNVTSNYQGLDPLPNTSIQETHRPVYEPLRTRFVEPTLKENDNGQHTYEPLDIRNKSLAYQSLQTNRKESDI